MPKQPVLYEAMYIVDASLDDSGIQTVAQTLEEQVRSLGGEIIATREFGRRRLAFEIEGHTTGTYMILYFNSHGEAVEEVRHEMRLIDGIVRGMVVVANPKAIFEPQAAAPAPAEGAASEATAEAPAAEEPAPEEPDMALAEATTPGVSVGEALAEPEGAAAAVAEEAEAPAEEPAAEAEVEEPAAEAEAEAPAEADAGEAKPAAEAPAEEA